MVHQPAHCWFVRTKLQVVTPLKIDWSNSRWGSHRDYRLVFINIKYIPAVGMLPYWAATIANTNWSAPFTIYKQCHNGQGGQNAKYTCCEKLPGFLFLGQLSITQPGGTCTYSVTSLVIGVRSQISWMSLMSHIRGLNNNVLDDNCDLTGWDRPPFPISFSPNNSKHIRIRTVSCRPWRHWPPAAAGSLLRSDALESSHARWIEAPMSYSHALTTEFCCSANGLGIEDVSNSLACSLSIENWTVPCD